MDVDEAAPCDVCATATAALWCDKCSVFLCESATCKNLHEGHPVGAISTADECEGVIEEAITEHDAYRLIDMVENCHVTCRRLLSPKILQAALEAIPLSSRRVSPHVLARVDVLPDVLRGNKPTLPMAAWTALASFSYVVLDGLFTQPEVSLARRETLAFVEAGALTRHANHLDVGRDESARDDLRAFLQEGSATDDDAGAVATSGNLVLRPGPLQHMLQTLKQLGRALSKEVQLQDVEAQEYQLAYYGSKGERYELHRDAMPNDGSLLLRGQVGRRITATCYLSEGWESSHGGELRLQVPLSPDGNVRTAVDVAPLPGRVVLFLSGAMDHEVRPSFQPRCALAAWYS